MSIIETDIWEPHPDKSGYVRYVKQRKAKDVFSELEKFLKSEDIYPDEYFLMNFRQDNPECDFPKMSDIICYAQWGNSEGIYLEVEIVTYDEAAKKYSRINFATGKTLSQTKEAYERMQYIAGRIYMAFMGESFQSPRYIVLENAPMKNREMLINKANAEYKALLMNQLVHLKKQPSELADTIGLAALIINVLAKGNLPDERIAELIEMDKMLETLYELCKHVIEPDQFEIEDTLASCRSFQSEGGEADG